MRLPDRASTVIAAPAATIQAKVGMGERHGDGGDTPADAGGSAARVALR